MSPSDRAPDAGAPEVTHDSVLDGRVRLAQPARGYRAAVDPVLLAAAVPLAPGQHALDLGCGSGAAALCLLARVPEGRVTGLELQPELARLARANAAANGLAGRLRVIEGDLLDPPAELAAGGFDHAFANPPYLPAGAADVPTDPLRAAASVEGAARLADWVAALARLTRRKGTLTLVHRADRLPELLAALSAHAGEIAVLPLWPAEGRAAKRVLVRGRVGTGGPARLLPGLTLHAAGGGYTEAARRVVKDAEGLEL